MVKLVTDESGSREARKTIKSYLKGGYSLYTVDIVLAKSLNAVGSMSESTRTYRQMRRNLQFKT